MPAELTFDVRADAATVWRAWTDPDWLSGWMVERAEGDIAAGGRVQWRWDSLGLELDLDVVACESRKRLVLRGAPAGRPPQTQTITMAERDGVTRVALTHSGFGPGPAGDGERAGTAAGWHVMLRVLAHYLAGHAGRRRECVAVLAPLAAPLGAIGRLLHDPRAGWLTDGAEAALAREGERFALEVAGGERMSGHVLALAPPFQLALAWDEIDGVLIARAIEVAPGTGGPVLAAAQAWSWSPERPAWRTARATLETAVARLVQLAGGAPGGAA